MQGNSVFLVVVLARQSNFFLRGCVMNQLNSLILEGNLVRDPVILEPSAGFKICKFSLGVNRFYKNKKDEGVDEVSFFDVETYGKLAEYCIKVGKKGRGVRVVGRLKQDSWKDDSGKSMNRVYVIAEHIEFKPMYTKSEDAPSAEKNEQEVVKPEPVPVVSELEKEAVTF